MFALATADAAFLVDGWDHAVASLMMERNHLDGTDRTLACTKSAWIVVMYGNAVVANPHGMTDLCRGLDLGSDRLDCACRADIGTACTLRSAEATFERHLGLHQVSERRRWTENSVRTFADTELASGTVLCKVADAEGTGRYDACLAVIRFLVGEGSQSAIHLYLILSQCGSAYGEYRSRHERTLRLVNGFGL